MDNTKEMVAKGVQERKTRELASSVMIKAQLRGMGRFSSICDRGWIASPTSLQEYRTNPMPFTLFALRPA
jgi:hypothetical protein